MRNIRLHKSGRFEARITIRGRSYSAYGETELEAAQNLEKKVVPSVRPSESPTLKQWMEGPYMTSVVHTSVKYHNQVNYSIKAIGTLADQDIKTINRAIIQAKVNELSKRLKPWSIKNIFTPIKAALKLAEIDELIPSNPARHVKLPTIRDDGKPVLTAEELKRLIDHSRGYSPHAAIVLCGLLGLRIGEVKGLTAKDFQKGKLTVPGTKTRASKREMPLPDMVLNELKDCTFPLANSQTNKAMAAAAWRAQMRHVHPHLLRHSFVSLLEWIGCPLDVRSRLVGHGKKSVTEGYSHRAWNTWEYWLNELCLHVFLGKELGTDQKEGAQND